MAAASPALDPAFFEYVLGLGDDALILGQRMAGWTAHAPIVEEDLALTNVALDLVGQARMWLTLAGELEGRGRDEDRLAYFRDAHEFRNLLLVERPNGNFADTIARQFLFDTRHFFLLQRLGESTDKRVVAIARKAVREVAYHVRRSGDWVVRLGDGTALSRERMQSALDDLWPYTGELFASGDVDREMARRGIGCELEALREPWSAHVRGTLAEATLAVPQDGWMHAGGRSGRHTEELSYVLAEMQSVRRAVPGDRW
ncbi:MAG: phenylacetate-CoA oxygenase subunit PaaC [Candidatus Eremiobacteraeota bacterium]|nr:phenylacetate-CoA oxygenase subunit PaaC [Candidatus Eremiobacteraeota bacterium]